MTTSPETLVEEIAGEFNTFLRKGGNLKPFIKEIDPNLNIDDIEKLFRIHFVLTPEVEEFVVNLPKRVRRIKTSVTKKTENSRDGVRGRIDWHRTLLARQNTNPKDSTIFTCRLSVENYDIHENIVLKKTISLIHDIIYNELKPALDGNYSWVKNWSKDKNSLKKKVDQVYYKNVYIRRINSKNIHVTERMISSALKSRNKLYREAGRLLLKYRKLVNYECDDGEAKQLLKTTFIKPDKIELLFELYWVFKILKQYRNVKFKLIYDTKDLIAEWEEKDHTYKMFHDSTGSLRFHETLDKLEIRGLGFQAREAKSMKKWSEIAEKTYEHKSNTIWGGRPDIILEKYDKETGELIKTFIGEVKYTTDKNYALQGLRELLEYMALIKENQDQYIEDIDKIYTGEKITGALFTDKIKHKKTKNKTIEIYTTHETPENTKI